MATTKEKWQEIANRGLQDRFDPATRAKFDEAVRRGLITVQGGAQPEVAQPEQPQEALGTLGTVGALRERFVVPEALELASVASSIAAKPIAGLAGLGTSAANLLGLTDLTGADAVRATEKALTFKPEAKGTVVPGALKGVGEVVGLIPKIPAGLAGLGQLAAGEDLGEAVRVIEDIKKSPSKAAGRLTQDITGSELAATAVETAIAGAPELIGGAGILKKTVGGRKSDIQEIIKANPADGRAAKFKLGKSRIGVETVVKDVKATEAIRQGFKDSNVGNYKTSTPETKRKLLKQVEIVERGKNDAKFRDDNSATDVVGKSLNDRLNVVRKTNDKAGKDLDKIARSLGNKTVDIKDAGNSFSQSIKDMKIKITPDGRPVFKGSEIQGSLGAESLVSKVLDRAKNTDLTNAREIHDFKRFLDEQLTFGKSDQTKPLTAKTSGIVKTLRKDIDNALDSKFPEYDKVNKVYAETIGTLNDFKAIAGKNIDLTGAASSAANGKLLRRTMGNADSRVRLRESRENIDRVAKKYGEEGKFKDDLTSQSIMADELERVIKDAVPQTSLKGQVDIPVTTEGAILRGAKAVTKKALNINEVAALKSMKELLREGI